MTIHLVTEFLIFFYMLYFDHVFSPFPKSSQILFTFWPTQLRVLLLLKETKNKNKKKQQKQKQQQKKQKEKNRVKF